MQTFHQALHDFWRRRHLFVLGLAMTCVASLAAMGRAEALYIVTGTEDSAIVLHESSAEIPDLASKLVRVADGSQGRDMVLTAGQTVTIHFQGTSTTAQARKETISALLDRLDITPGPLDMVAVDLSSPSGVVLTITDQLTCYEEVSEDVKYETRRVANPDLAKGVERVVQAGADGQRTAIYEVIWSGGQLVSRQFVEEVSSTATPEIIEYGTGAKTVSADDRITNITKNADGSGTLHFRSGAALNFSGAKNMTATAYTAGHGGADYTTATGTLVKVGTVAVDKRVIPLGTRMYIVSNDGSVVYGMAVAEDTGVVTVSGLAALVNIRGSEVANDRLTLNGGAGDDILIGGPGQDVLDGGTGDNILIQD